MKLSIVIPVFNEEASLRALHGELDEVAAEHGYELDVVFVDDGSSDNSWKLICALARDDRRVRGIRFRRNFGKAAALNAGFRAALGDVVLTLDADLQDDPHEIPRFLAEMDAGFDVVSGWKQTRHDPWHKVGPSRVFNCLVGALTGVKLHDHNCGYKCYRREIFREVRLYGELHRFVPVLAAARGYRVSEIVIHHRPRKFGHSKYGLWRIPKGFLDLMTVKFLTGYGQRPQHVLGMIGLGSFALGGIGLTILLLWRLASWRLSFLDPIHLHERVTFYLSLGGLLLGAQLMSIGFIAELITHTQGREEHVYSIAERTDDKRPEPAEETTTVG